MRIFLYSLLALGVYLAGAVAIGYAADTVVSENAEVVITGEITSIEGDGFALKHENGTTLVSLKDVSNDEKTILQDAHMIKAGNRVTVTGTLEKGDFNHPILKASHLVVAAIPEIAPSTIENIE